MLVVPDSFARCMAEVHGPGGRDWVARLPALVADCERRWRIRLGPPFPNLSYNYVAPAVREDGTSVVLKAGYPGKELLSEIEALRLFAGRGTVGLLDADPEPAVLLIEHVQPGTPLSRMAESDDQRATIIAARLMRGLRRPAPAEHTFPTVADWARGFERLRCRFNGGTGPLPASLVERAEALYAELQTSSGDGPALLHGDLHHDNILHGGGDRWLVIDPKGLVGEPVYETGALLRNPIARLLHWPDLPRILARRIAILSDELGYERARIRDWAFAQAVLSAWWHVEDHGYGWEKAIACAELLAEFGV